MSAFGTLFSWLSPRASFFTAGMRGAGGKIWNAAKGGAAALAHSEPANVANQAKMLVAGAMLPLILPGAGSAKERMHAAGVGLLQQYAVMGMRSPSRQIFWGTALSMMPAFGPMAKSFYSTYRSSIENRTTAAVPFSHSSLSMDQAFTTMQYARSRMQESYTGVGSEAGFMAARYLQR